MRDVSPKMNNKFVNLLLLASVIVFLRNVLFIKAAEPVTPPATEGETAAEKSEGETSAPESTPASNPASTGSGSTGESSSLGDMMPFSPDSSDTAAASDDDNDKSVFEKYKWLIIIAFVIIIALVVAGIVIGVLKNKK